MIRLLRWLLLCAVIGSLILGAYVLFPTWFDSGEVETTPKSDADGNGDKLTDEDREGLENLIRDRLKKEGGRKK